MTYDLNAYRRTIKPLVKTYLEQHFGEELNMTLSVLALATSCPIVCICHFVQELEGESDALTRSIDRLSLFYHVEEIKGKL